MAPTGVKSRGLPSVTSSVESMLYKLLFLTQAPTHPPVSYSHLFRTSPAATNALLPALTTTERHASASAMRNATAHQSTNGSIIRSVDLSAPTKWNAQPINTSILSRAAASANLLLACQAMNKINRPANVSRMVKYAKNLDSINNMLS